MGVPKVFVISHCGFISMNFRKSFEASLMFRYCHDMSYEINLSFTPFSTRLPSPWGTIGTVIWENKSAQL